MIFIRVGALAGLLGVAFGAFGAHALRERLAPEMHGVYQTGVLYHLVHALAVLAVGILADRNPSGALSASGWAFTAGLMLFSGSLYGLALSGLRVLGTVTPVGGVAFLIGWIALAWSTVR
jgi:uncharacterized membrane protein YgdD (TMEM256/DUF423 family)